MNFMHQSLRLYDCKEDNIKSSYFNWYEKWMGKKHKFPQISWIASFFELINIQNEKSLSLLNIYTYLPKEKCNPNNNFVNVLGNNT